ncbi:DUF2235 domain-containing protein [Luteimonas kalidii]|uniref:DUF2235 domain-containing protein n=1 Tax=Luteimonas kalidii TaxID=3042025 RepID=A0ABT6JRN6_9GAMM|nr:DUF2235 domain-containing protein [Luteimonas kalidii]MDH5833348.1 DUF2235 domain-containing protein [Luteimonas kalidii]
MATFPATAEDLQAFDQASAQLEAFRAPVLLRRDSFDRLFVAAFDGTGNSRHRDPPENHTNIAAIHQQLQDRIDGDEHATGGSALGAGYVEGVGTQGGLDGTIDLIRGRTYEARLEDMYLQFARQAKIWLDADPDVEIRIASIGFSRGAEQAAGFTRLVEQRGIQDPTGADVERGRDGLIERVEFTRPPLREPGTVVQAIGLFDPVGTGVPREHDRRPAASVVSGFQLTAEHERRNLFQGTRVADMGATFDGRFLNVLVPGAHSDVGGGYRQNGLSIRSGNLMVDYLNALGDQPFLAKRAEPQDPALNVIHRSEQHQIFYRTSEFDRDGIRVHQEDLAPPPLCRIDCRDAEPRNEAMAAGLDWRPVPIGPRPVARIDASAATDHRFMVERMLDAARRGDGAAIDGLSLGLLEGPLGQAWLAAGEERLHGIDAAARASGERSETAFEPRF